VNVTERLVLCTEDLYIAIGDAYKQRKKVSDDKDLRKKSHFVISLNLVK
jgi:hypothetical protein